MYCFKKFKPLFEMDGERFDTFVLTGGRGSMARCTCGDG